MVTRLGVVLLSGGLDSTTVAAQALRDGWELAALTVRYGQAHAREVEAAVAVAAALGISHKVVDVSFFRDLAWYSALTHPERFTLPTGREPRAMAQDIPISYVPLRNTFFLTLAGALLESDVLDRVERGALNPRDTRAAIFVAANALDYSGYPDCRPEFYQAAVETLRLGSKAGAEHGLFFEIQTPIIDKTKADIARLGLENGAPLALTWSCYRGAERPCGECDSCVLRAKGFAEAGIPDPALSPG